MMNNSEEFKTPVGHIGMILHKGGEYDVKTDTIKGGEIIQKAEFKNLIVNSASVLMAQRMAPGSGPNINTGTFINDGLQYLAVGKGYGGTGFDYMNPKPAAVTDTKLRDEIARKEFTSWTFVDPVTGNNTSSPTNILKLSTTFLETEAVGPLVEMGLFGGNATSTKDSGYMFNYKTFPVWNKPNDARLIVSRVA